MCSWISDDFVNGIKNKITDDEIHSEFKKNILLETIDFLVESFEKSGKISFKGIKNYEEKESCFFLDFCTEFNLNDLICSSLNESSISYTNQELVDYRSVFLIDLEGRLVTSGHKHNLFNLEIYSKRTSVYKLKISIHTPDLNYSLFDRGYHKCKFWVFDKTFSVYDVSLKNIKRDRKTQKVETDDGKYSVSLILNEIGELNSIKLSRKREKKRKVSL